MRLPFFKHDIPFEYDIELDGEVYRFRFDYNAENDFFTYELYQNGTELVSGHKITYGVDIFEGVRDTRFPNVDITPYDESGEDQEITFDNMGETVFLYVSDRS